MPPFTPFPRYISTLSPTYTIPTSQTAPPATKATKDPDTTLGAIIGITCGVAVGCVLLAWVLAYFCKGRRKPWKCWDGKNAYVRMGDGRRIVVALVPWSGRGDRDRGGRVVDRDAHGGAGAGGAAGGAGRGGGKERFCGLLGGNGGDNRDKDGPMSGRGDRGSNGPEAQGPYGGWVPGPPERRGGDVVELRDVKIPRAVRAEPRRSPKGSEERRARVAGPGLGKMGIRGGGAAQPRLEGPWGSPRRQTRRGSPRQGAEHKAWYGYPAGLGLAIINPLGEQKTPEVSSLCEMCLARSDRSRVVCPHHGAERVREETSFFSC